MLFSRALILCILVCGTWIVSGQPPQTRSVTRTSDVPPAYRHNGPEPPVVAPVPTRPIIIVPPIPLSWLHIDPECHGGNTQPPEKVLSERGPQFPSEFSMSNLSVVGFVKGDWPMVLDYEVREPGMFLLSISAEGVAPFFYVLEGTQPARRQQILRIPARFGNQPIAGHFAVQALTNKPGEATPVFLRVFGIGAGERAVGSVAIDQLHFTPPSVRPKDKQTALYGFHSHADFEKVTAEFQLVGLMDGAVVGRLEYQEDVKDLVRRDTEIQNKPWDPRKAKAAPGQHLFQVRAWYTLKKGGDWVIAWSPQLVRVEE
jgi:hypothetical protein